MLTERTAAHVQTLPTVFERSCARAPDVPALLTDQGRAVTWAQTRATVHRLAGGLRARGIERGRTLAMMLVNRPEFLFTDLATQYAGGTPTSLFPNSPPGDIAYVFDDADVAVVVTERRFEAAVREAAECARTRPEVVVLEDEGDAGLAPLLDACPDGWDGTRAGEAIGLDDGAMIIYTSGTTGAPKGVALTHRNLSATWRAALSIDDGVAGLERMISYLPAAHIADRFWGYVAVLRTGATVTYVADPRQIGAALPAVRPSAFLGVPRIWEKLRTLLMKAVPEGASASDPDVAADLQARLGLDSGAVALTGAAPLDPAVHAFFDQVGISILELYGMTETSGLICASRRHRRRHGTVGYPLDGIEVSLAGDGEILVRGDDILMGGYLGKPEQTTEALSGGWMHTGDVGRFDDGLLTLIDRKKEIIVTSGGKNLSPANIENAIRSATPLAGPVLAVGDGRSYVAAIISLDPDECGVWARANGIGDGVPLAELAARPELRGAIAAAIEQANRSLVGVGQIRRFTVVGELWDPTTGLVTPTLKLKRRVATARYAEEIDRLYADTAHE